MVNLHNMTYIPRQSEDLVMKYLKAFPVVGVMGPRQSGKSTMLKKLLGNEYTFVTFDDLQVRQLFYDDPVRFFNTYSNKVVFDEAQQIPELFPFLKMAVDSDRSNYGKFVVTGSGQFLLGKHVSESLAGRIGLVPLLPFQLSEIPENNRMHTFYWGCYPEIVTRDFYLADAWHNSYLETYLQKDVRQLLNIGDIHAFTLFLRALAANACQLFNLSSISRDTGIPVSTLKRWLSVLEASYIIFQLQPYFNNFGKRIIKSPRIFFYDNGLLSFLVGITGKEDWERGLMYGALFENLIVADLMKKRWHEGQYFQLYYHRTSNGDEIDLIIDFGQNFHLVEIKASHTYKPAFHKVIEKYKESASHSWIVYQGKTFKIDHQMMAINYEEFLSISDWKSIDQYI
ncbi:MAG: ATP-binding protein [Bacteroidales bacterium]|nr:ATP-binding protein [Bacteroidales bacterium]